MPPRSKDHGKAMVPTQIRYFLILYDELNFTRAAKRCGVSQPSLTNGIKNLESRCGGNLFIRIRSSQSRTQPTDLAIALKPHFQRMIDIARLAQKTAEQVLAKQRHYPGINRHAGETSARAIRTANGAASAASPPTTRRLASR
jgi:DNA-binding transcriptional LysR family regulator